MKAFGRLRNVGSGTGDIIEKCRESGLPPPQWESEDDGLTIILRRATIASQPKAGSLVFNASQSAPKHHGDALDDALELRLRDALRKESSLDQVELSKVLGVSHSPSAPPTPATRRDLRPYSIKYNEASLPELNRFSGGKSVDRR